MAKVILNSYICRLTSNRIHKAFLHLIEDNDAEKQNAETENTRIPQSAPIEGTDAEKSISETLHNRCQWIDGNKLVQLAIRET